MRFFSPPTRGISEERVVWETTAAARTLTSRSFFPENEKVALNSMSETDQAKLEREEKCKDKGIEAAKILTKGLNTLSDSDRKAMIDGFVRGITVEHRSLQQRGAEVIYAVIKQWAEDFKNGRFDGRNQCTVTWASQCMEATGEVQFPFI